MIIWQINAAVVIIAAKTKALPVNSKISASAPPSSGESILVTPTMTSLPETKKLLLLG